MAEKTIRRVYVFSEELYAMLTGEMHRHGDASETETVRRILHGYLLRQESPQQILVRMEAAFEASNLRDAAHACASHPNVAELKIDDDHDAISFRVTDEWFEFRGQRP